MEGEINSLRGKVYTNGVYQDLSTYGGQLHTKKGRKQENFARCCENFWQGKRGDRESIVDRN